MKGEQSFLFSGFVCLTDKTFNLEDKPLSVLLHQQYSLTRTQAQKHEIQIMLGYHIIKQGICQAMI